MAVRNFFYINGDGNLQESNSQDIADLNQLAGYIYSLSAYTGVTLSVSALNNGNLGDITDTRFIASVHRTSTSQFLTPDQLTTIDINFNRINQTVQSASEPVNTDNIRWPLSRFVIHLRSMSSTDFVDTFITPSVANIKSSGLTTTQGGSYFISTETSITGSTRVSSIPIFTDTRANPAVYSALNIPEPRDKDPVTVINYYLYQITPPVPATPVNLPVYFDGTDIRQYTFAEWVELVGIWLKHRTGTGGEIRYNFNGSGTTRGTIINDTRVNSDVVGNRRVSQTDYRSQRFPAGTAQIVNSYEFKIE